MLVAWVLGARIPAAHAESASEPPAKPFRVSYSSSTSCTDETEFTRSLQSMTLRWRPAVGSEPSHTFFVHLSATQAGAHGQLGVLEPKGALLLREVETADCHTVLTALAFIAAVMADPLAPPPPPPTVRVETLRPGARRSRERSEAVKPWRGAVGIGILLDGGFAPQPSPGVAALGELSHVSGALFDPSARLALRVGRSSDSNAAGSASFRLESARLSLCPLRTQVSWLDVRPCAFAEAGSLVAQGFGTVDNRSQSLFWSAAGAQAIVDFLRLGPLTLELEGGVSFPFRHDKFYFDADPESPIHAIPSVAGSGSLSLLLRAF